MVGGNTIDPVNTSYVPFSFFFSNVMPSDAIESGSVRPKVDTMMILQNVQNTSDMLSSDMMR